MKRFIAAIALLALPMAAAAQSAIQLCPSDFQTEQGGCIVTGSGQSWIPEPGCSYKALDGDQTVVVATANSWAVSVNRLCPEKPYGCNWTYSDGGCVPDPATAQGSCAPVRKSNGQISKVCTTVTLAAGDTVTGYAGYATTPGPITVHPTPGEVVTVRLWDIAPAGQSLHAVGSYGGVAVGVEDRP